MGSAHRLGDIDVAEDVKFTKKSWAAERVGWVGLVLVIVAGVLGLLGPGLFSQSEAGKGGAGPRRRARRAH